MANTTDPIEIVPTVGMAGLYSLKAPYAALVRSQVEYVCTAVTSLRGALANGGDPLNEVYKLHGDTEDNYKTDLAAGRSLVTLQAGIGDNVTVPASAINGMPIADGVAYRSAVMGISLSILPEDYDLAQIKTDISNLVFDKLGVRSTVYASVIGGRLILPHDTHAAIEASRLANVEFTPSDSARVRQLELEKTALQAQLTQLETYIKAHLPP